MTACELRIYEKTPGQNYRTLRAHEECPSMPAAFLAFPTELEMMCDADGDLVRVYGGRHTEEVRFQKADPGRYEGSIALPDGREFPIDEVGCCECGAPFDSRDGWVEKIDEQHVEHGCPGACAEQVEARWSPLLHVTIQQKSAAPRRLFARRLRPFTYLVCGNDGLLTGETIESNAEEATERPARVVDGAAEVVRQWAIREKGWSPRSRVRGLHGFIVGELLNPRYGLVDGHCAHGQRSEADKCKKHREAGGASCINHKQA